MRRFASTSLVLSTLALAVLAVVATQSAQAQTIQVIHAFTGGADGAGPYAGVTIDASGNLYGTTSEGGKGGGGIFPGASGWTGQKRGSAPRGEPERRELDRQ